MAICGDCQPFFTALLSQGCRSQTAACGLKKNCDAELGKFPLIARGNVGLPACAGILQGKTARPPVAAGRIGRPFARKFPSRGGGRAFLAKPRRCRGFAGAGREGKAAADAGHGPPADFLRAQGERIESMEGKAKGRGASPPTGGRAPSPRPDREKRSAARRKERRKTKE